MIHYIRKRPNCIKKSISFGLFDFIDSGRIFKKLINIPLFLSLSPFVFHSFYFPSTKIAKEVAPLFFGPRAVACIRAPSTLLASYPTKAVLVATLWDALLCLRPMRPGLRPFTPRCTHLRSRRGCATILFFFSLSEPPSQLPRPFTTHIHLHFHCNRFFIHQIHFRKSVILTTAADDKKEDF